MIYEATYSLRRAIELGVPEANEVQIMYDGVDLTSIQKPFITVMYLQDSPEELSAGHRSYNDTINYQVGVHATNVSERYLLESKVRNVLRKPKGHTLYAYDEESGVFTETDVKTPYYDNGFTPMTNDDNSSQTNNHRGYFDVAIEILT